MRFTVIILALALALTACSTSASTTTPATASAATLHFTAATVDGETFEGRKLQGKPLVLWFWTPWCAICRSEAPMISQAANRHVAAVTIIGVAGRGEGADMRRFVNDTDLTGLTHIADVDGRVWRRFGVASQPAFAFVDGSGRVDVFPGSLPEEDLDARIAALDG